MKKDITYSGIVSHSDLLGSIKLLGYPGHPKFESGSNMYIFIILLKIMD